MSKKAKDPLFRLVKQMSKSEKRHFSLNYRGQKKKPIHYQLFEAVNKMNEWEPQRLKKICPSNLSRYKSILYDKILQAMRDYEGSNANSVKIKELLIDARYLLERSLYDLGESRLKEAKKLAGQIGDQLALLEINQQERHLFRVNTNEKVDYQKIIDESIEEKESNIQNLIEEYTCLDNYDKLFATFRTRHVLKSDSEKEELIKQFSVNSFDLNAIPDALMAKRRFFQALALYYQLLGDFTSADEYHSKIIEWWDENIEFRKEADYWYLADLSNFLQAYLIREDLGGMKSILDKIEEFKIKNEHTKRLSFHVFNNNNLSYLIEKRKFEEAEQMIPEIKKGLKEFEINPTSKLALFCNIVFLYFILEDQKELKYWNGRILGMLPTSYRQDVQAFALIIDVIIMFEKDKYLPDTKAFKLAYKYFYRIMRLPKSSFEKTSLRALSKISNSAPSDRMKELISFQKQLDEIKNAGNSPTGLDAIIFWTESKITKKPLAEIVRDNLKKPKPQ